MRNSVKHDNGAVTWEMGGFTLIEVLASLVLGALLLTALGGTLSGLKKQSDAAHVTISDLAWRRRLIDLLEQDLANAQTLAIHSDAFTLAGSGGRDSTTGRGLLTPARITYRLVGGSPRLLVREEVLLTAAPDRATIQLLAVGVEELLIGRAEDRIKDLRIPVPAAATPHLLPESIRVILIGDQKGVLVDTVFANSSGAPR